MCVCVCVYRRFTLHQHLISLAAAAMVRKNCHAGSSWDRVVKSCIEDRRESRAVTKPPTGEFF